MKKLDDVPGEPGNPPMKPTIAPHWRELSETGQVAIATGVAAAVSLAYVVLAGRGIGPAEYADFAATLSLVSFSAVLMGSMTLVANQLAAEYHTRGETARVGSLVRMLVRRTLAVAVVGLLPAALIIPRIGAALNLRSTFVLYVGYAIVSLSVAVNFVRSGLRGAHDFLGYGMNVATESMVRLASGLLLLRIWPVAGAAAGAYVIATGSAIALWIPSRGEPGDEGSRHDLRRTKSLFGAATLLVGGIAISQSVDMLLVKRFFSQADAGAYGAAWSLAKGMGVAAMPFEIVLLPRLVRARETGASVLRVVGVSVVPLLILAALPLAVVAIWPEQIVVRLFGRGFASAASVLPLLLAAFLLMQVAYFLGQAVTSLGTYAINYLYGIMVAMVAVLLFVWHPSLRAVATTMCVAQSIFVVLFAAALPIALRRRRSTATRPQSDRE